MTVKLVNPFASQPKTAPKVSAPEIKPQIKDEAPLPELEAPPAYGSLGTDDNGLPFYGDGFKGWVRKTWADLTDPNKYFQDVNKLDDIQKTQIQLEYEAKVKSYGDSIAQNPLSKWGERVFGLKPEEVGRQFANVEFEQKIAGEVYKKTGSILDSKPVSAFGRAVRLGVDTTQNLIWGGLEILSLDDTAMRKLHATAQGIDAVADRFNKDTADTWYKKLYSDNPFEVSKDLFTIAGAVVKNKISWGEAWKETGKYRAASDMAYTMIWDEIAKAKFEKGLAEGRDPALLAQELGSAGIELAGSILGSPSTYLGLGLKAPVLADIAKYGDEVRIFTKTFNVPWRTVARIPTFGDMLYATTGLKFGEAGLRKGLQLFTSETDMSKWIDDAGKVLDEKSAKNAITKLVQERVSYFDNIRKEGYKFFNFDSSGKVDVVGRHSGLFINSIFSGMAKGTDDGLKILRDLQIMAGGGDDAVAAAGRLYSTGYGKHLMSEVAFMTGDILNQLAKSDIARVIKDNAGDPVKLGKALNEKLSPIIHDMIPSVDEMFKAAEEVKEARKAGKFAKARTEKLAKMFEDVPDYVKRVTRGSTLPKGVVRTTDSAMALNFMHLTPRAFAKNIEGQSLLTAIHLGLRSAIEAAITSIGGLNEGVTHGILKSKEAMLIERTGMTSTRLKTGVGKMVPRDFKLGPIKIPGFIHSIGRGESIFRTEILLTKASDEILKALPKVTEGLPEWQRVIDKLPKGEKSLLYAAIKRNYGDFDKSVETLRGWYKDGAISIRKLIEPNEILRKELDGMGLMEGLYKFQDTAKSPQEFEAFIAKFSKKYHDEVLAEAKKLPWLANSPESLSDLAQTLAERGDTETQRVMNGVIQSWENTKEQMRKVVGLLEQKFDSVAQGNPEVLQKWQAIKPRLYGASNMVGTYNKDVIRQEINIFNDVIQEDMSIDLLHKIWKNPIKGAKNQEIFNLSKIYPEVPLDELTPQKVKDLMWDAYFEYRSNVFFSSNIDNYDKSLLAMDEAAKLLGTSLEEIAGTNQSGQNIFLLMEQLKAEAVEIEQVHAFKRLLKSAQASGASSVQEAAAKYKNVFQKWNGDLDWLGVDDIESAKKILKKKILISPYAGTLPNEARTRAMGLDNFLNDVKAWKDEIVSSWDATVPSAGLDVEAELRTLKPAFEKRMATVKMESMAVAEATADFLLHDYNKTYADHALSYLLGNSFHYWTTRTYKKSLETLIANPKYANAYLSLKEYNQKRHSELPPWLRNNVVISNLPGMDPNNEYFVNLESMVNPIYGLTGVDFNDPRKRVDNVTRLIDDMNRLGPTFSPLVSWALAVHLYNKGEQDASERWLGRLFPQTSMIKSTNAKVQDVLGKFGVQTSGKPLELDPFVNFMEGNTTPYERNQIAATMAVMVQKGMTNPITGQPITREDMIDASQFREGPLWDMAVKYNADRRFANETSSFFLGAGVQRRTQEDKAIFDFWNKYNVLISSRNMMSADDYRRSWDKLREDFAFTDALLISRKTGVEQLTALTYNVMSRIEPGQSSQLAELAGIKPYMLDAFYENKGDFDRMGLNEQDRARFEAGIVDLMLLLELPDKATREEWGYAKSEYAKMNEEMSVRFGRDIQLKFSEFFDVPQADREDWLSMNPHVAQAMDFKNQYVVSNPILTTYYGGTEAVARYLNNQVYQALDDEFGDMTDTFKKYNDLQLKDEKLAAKFKKIHLSRYYDMQSKLFDEADAKFQQVAPNILESMPMQLRPQFQEMSGYQQGVAGATQQQGMTWEDWQGVLSPALQSEIIKTIQQGGDLKYSARTQLRKSVEVLGLDEYEAMRQIRLLLSQ